MTFGANPLADAMGLAELPQSVGAAPSPAQSHADTLNVKELLD